MKCDNFQPIFNYKMNTCMKCPQNSNWVSDKGKCITEIGGATV